MPKKNPVSLRGFVAECQRDAELALLWKRFVMNAQVVIRHRLRVVLNNQTPPSTDIDLELLKNSKLKLVAICEVRGIALPNLALHRLAAYAIRHGA